MEGVLEVVELGCILILLINIIWEDPVDQINISRQQRDARSILGFLDEEKRDGIPNASVPIVITIVIANPFVSRILLNDKSSCNKE